MTCKAAVCLYQGYRSVPRPARGLGALRWRLEQGPCRDRVETYLSLQEWDSDPALSASWIASREPRKIFIVGHSYGCGHAALALARALADYGLTVRHAYLIGPVPRFRVRKWRSMWSRGGELVMPGNVEGATYWRQLNDNPYERPVVMHDGTAARCGGVWADSGNIRHARDVERNHTMLAGHVRHTNIDDQPEIHDAIVNDLHLRIGGVR